MQEETIGKPELRRESIENLLDNHYLEHPIQKSLNLVIAKAFLKFSNYIRNVEILIFVLLETEAYLFKFES